MRAPGESIGTFALESAMDELAHELRMDPIELRRINEPEKDPTKDTEFSSRHLTEAYRRGAEKFGWNARNPRAALPTGRKMAGRAGCRNGLLSFPPFSSEGSRADMRGRIGDCAGACERDGDGDGDGADSACRRSPRLAAASGYVSIWRFQLARYPDDGGRLESDRDYFRGGAGGGGTSPSRTAEAGAESVPIRRSMARNTKTWKRVTAGCFAPATRRAERTYSAILQKAGQASVEAEASSGPPTGDDEIFDGVLRRAILRGAGP